MAFTARGRFILAASRGHTHSRMLRMLGEEEVPSSWVHVLQVDERITSLDDPDPSSHQPISTAFDGQ